MMIRVAAFGLALFACHGAAPVRPAAATGPAVTGRVVLAPGVKPDRTRGALFVSWMTADEKQAFDSGKPPLPLVVSIVTRGVVVNDVDVAHDVPFTLHTGTGRVALTATIDVSHAGLSALFGAGEGTLAGMSGIFDASGAAVNAPPLALTVQPHQELRELCQGERITLERIAAPEVAGMVGNPTSRRSCVRVPRGYAEHPDRRYPVIYALPGLLSNDGAVIAGYHLDPDDVIVVAVDTSTKTGSTYLIDSPTSGKWDTYFAKHLIPYVDAHYRTLARREGRAIVGHSTGGFNAVSYGMRHPELFGVIGASSPDGLDLPVWLHLGETRWIRDLARIEHGLGGAGQFISYAADWSPTTAPPGYDWPFDDAGDRVDSVLARWLANSPTTWVRDPGRVAAFKPLSGHIYLTVGETDEFDLLPPTEAFSKTLTAAGIANELVITPGGHGVHAQHMAAIARFCAAKLAPAK
jgi:pimeloyl-ACP methyl ester carboxylesterase